LHRADDGDFVLAGAAAENHAQLDFAHFASFLGAYSAPNSAASIVTSPLHADIARFG
jgi:hypothetical protein